MAQSNALFDRLLNSPKLPSAPAIAIRLLELAQDPDSSTRDIVNVIKADPALAAKVLKSANSTFFSFRSEIKTLEQAVPLIGRTAITSLALSFSLANEATSDERLAKQYQRFWLQSIVQASAGEILANQLGAALSSELFMTCLLIDVGQLAMLKVLRNDYAPVMEEADSTSRPVHELELERYGFSHADVGAKLMEKWKLPAVMIQAATLHHASAESIAEVAADSPLVTAAAMSAAVGNYFCGSQTGSTLLRLRELGERFLQLDQHALSSFLQRTDERIKQTGDLLSTNTADLRSADELMAEACEQLAQISIQQERERQEVATKQQQAELEKQVLMTQNEQLREQVFRDPLTGVYNRRFFDETIANASRRCIRNGSPIAVLFIDADHFKRLNDTYGHKFGDAVLIKIASLLQANIRGSDIVARYGGEEFVILAMDATEAGLRVLGERIRSTIEAEPILHAAERVPVTVSVGAAILTPQRTDTDLDSRLVEAADAAMYESKRRGRNRLTIHSLTSEIERKLTRMMASYRFSQWLIEHKLIDAAVIQELVAKTKPRTNHLGELALRHNWLNLAELQNALELQESSGERFGSVAHRLGLLTEQQLACLLGEQVESPELLAENLIKQGSVDAQEALTLLERFREHIEKLLATPQPIEAAAVVTS